MSIALPLICSLASMLIVCWSCLKHVEKLLNVEVGKNNDLIERINESEVELLKVRHEKAQLAQDYEKLSYSWTFSEFRKIAKMPVPNVSIPIEGPQEISPEDHQALIDGFWKPEGER